jgi:hypothetical protein
MARTPYIRCNFPQINVSFSILQLCELKPVCEDLRTSSLINSYALFLMDFRKGVKRVDKEDKMIGDKRTKSKKGKS